VHTSFDIHLISINAARKGNRICKFKFELIGYFEIQCISDPYDRAAIREGRRGVALLLSNFFDQICLFWMVINYFYIWGIFATLTYFLLALNIFPALLLVFYSCSLPYNFTVDPSLKSLVGSNLESSHTRDRRSNLWPAKLFLILIILILYFCNWSNYYFKHKVLVVCSVDKCCLFCFTIQRPYARNNLSWSCIWAKFCQLIVSLFVILPQFNLTKSKLDYLNFDLKYKKERYKHRRNFFCITRVRFIWVQLKFAFRTRRKHP